LSILLLYLDFVKIYSGSGCRRIKHYWAAGMTPRLQLGAHVFLIEVVFIRVEVVVFEAVTVVLLSPAVGVEVVLWINCGDVFK
jgi:hypothetical protein